MIKQIKQPFKQLYNYIRSLFKSFFKHKTYAMAIVRRYVDANGAFVGELYLLGTFAGVLQYNMIGMSLDTLPFTVHEVAAFDLDIRHDFLHPMPEGCVRVGAQDPRDDTAVRVNVARLARDGKIVLQIQNRFVEYVMSRPGRPRGREI